MLYAALTFWVLVIIFTAWAVHSLWSAMVNPRVVNTALLPGTLVAQIGHVLGLLVTGQSVTNATLMRDDDRGDPQADSPERPRIPVIGPIVTGMLPLMACAVSLHIASRYWGAPVLDLLGAEGAVRIPAALPTSVDGVWNLLHSGIYAAQAVFDAARQSDWTQWQTALFLYLAVCLTLRMTPFEGNRRGAIGAAFLFGLVLGLLSLAIPGVESSVAKSWTILSFAVGVLLLLLLASLAVTGVVGFVRIFARSE